MLSSNNQTNYEIVCPKCKKIPGASIKTGKAFMTHICHENCGNIYWTLQQCPGCDYPEATSFVQKPRYSQLIQCKHCAKQFYLFLCPKNDCKSLFFKQKNSYLMGIELDCQLCKFTYKSVVCQCGFQNIFDKNQKMIQGQYAIKQCKICKKPVIYTICTNCFKTNYHSEQLQLGQRIKCIHCKSVKQYVPCPKCGRETAHKSFSFCKYYQCQFCTSGFQYSCCPFCTGQNYHFTSKALGPNRKCQNKNCRSSYYVLSCLKCEGPVYFQEYDISQGRQEDCPKCKGILKFYYCSTCHKFNPVDSKCSNSKCPPPKKIKSYSRQANLYSKKKQQQKQKQLTKKYNQNYQEHECKICCNDTSCMVNNTCRHVMMCQKCFKAYQRKGNANQQNNSAACPICKKIGVYTKTIEYIYA